MAKIGKNKMSKIVYKGWSSVAGRLQPKRRFLTTNIQTVKDDLLNHIWTAPGERLMHPQFGTRIPLMMFEPLDEITLKIIETDLRMVFDFDPRVELLDLSIMALPDNSAVMCLADLRYLELDVSDTWKLNFPFVYR